MNIHRSLFTMLVAGWLLFLQLGCGLNPGSSKPRGNVSITILYDGDPVTKGMVNLENIKSGEGGGGVLNGLGKISLSYVVLGEYTVVVLPPDLEPPKPEDESKPQLIPEYQNIPQKFRNSKTSTLKLEIKPEETHYTFDLKEALEKSAE